MTSILILEDDDFLREGVTALLEKEGYDVTAARNLRTARERIAERRFDLCLLDVRLPDGSGLDLCRELRADGDGTPLLFLTACDEETEIVSGLDAGGDDYVTKPFKLRELLSRIRALLRRSGKTAPQEFPMPDPAEQEREQAAVKAQLAELEASFKSGEVGYDEYVRRRMEIISRL